MEPMDVTTSSERHETAGTSCSSTGNLAAGCKPVGVIAPQKRAVANITSVAGPSRLGGAVSTSIRPVSAAVGVFAGQPNRVGQLAPSTNLVQTQHGTQPRLQQSTQPQVLGNRIVHPEKRKLIQQQLLLLLHANQCQGRQNQANGEQRQLCTLPHCRTIKNLLNHLSTCNASTNCTVSYCNSSRQILCHWKHCVRTDCPVCLLLKQVERNWHTKTNGAAASAELWLRLYVRLFGDVAASAPNQANTQPPTSAAISTANVTPGISVPPTTQPSVLPGAQGVSRGVQVLAPGATTNVRLTHPGSPGPEQLEVGTSQHVVAPNVSLPLSSDPSAVTGVRAAVAAAAMTTPTSGTGAATVHQPTAATSSDIVNNIQQQIVGYLNEAGQPGSILTNENRRLSNMQLPGGLQSAQIAESFVQGTQEWHQSVTPDLRNHLVHKIVRAIFPDPDPRAMFDRRMLNLVSYARKVEVEMYEMANSRPVYYHLIAEKIYKIQKELEEKRQRHRETQQRQAQQQQQQQQQQRPAAPANTTGKTVKPVGAVQPTRRTDHSTGTGISSARERQIQQAQAQLHNLYTRDRALTENECWEILMARARELEVSLRSQQASTSVAETTPQARPSSSSSEPSAAPLSNDAQDTTPSTSNTQPMPPASGSAQESRKCSIKICIEALVHSCQCRDTNCELARCKKMKRVVQHIKTCKRRTRGGCSICKQLVALCCHHARHCQEAKCPVPFCFNIKQKIKHQQHHRRMQQTKLIRSKSTALFKIRGRRL